MKLNVTLLTRDEVYKYFKHQKIPSENKDLLNKQVTKADKTFVFRFKLKWLKTCRWHVYREELKGKLCKVCILFDQKIKSTGEFSSKEHIRILVNLTKY